MWPGRVVPVNCTTLISQSRHPLAFPLSPCLTVLPTPLLLCVEIGSGPGGITYPAKNMSMNHEPGTANTSIASSACRLPAIRHGMHASMSRLLITNINLAGSWLCKMQMRISGTLSEVACIPRYVLEERPQGNRYSFVHNFDNPRAIITRHFTSSQRTRTARLRDARALTFPNRRRY